MTSRNATQGRYCGKVGSHHRRDIFKTTERITNTPIPRTRQQFKAVWCKGFVDFDIPF